MRLIDADELYKTVTEKYRDIVEGMYPYNIVAYDMSNLVKDAPTIEAVPVVHGEWIDGKCSNCGVYIPTDTRIDFIPEEECEFCYSCGADMRKKV